jgi:hypothetical protein
MNGINIGIHQMLGLITIAEVCPENNFGRQIYTTLKEAWSPQVLCKILVSLPIAAIYEVKPPLLVLLKVCSRAAQKQLTVASPFIVNQQTITEPS